MDSGGTQALEQARSASAERRWSDACRAYAEASTSGLVLAGDDQCDWGYAAYWSRDVDGALDRLEKAADQLLAEGRPVVAAETMQLCIQIAAWGNRSARVVALYARMESLLQSIPTAAPHAINAWAQAWMTELHDIEKCAPMAEQSLHLARQVESGAAEALCLTLLSRIDVHRGDMAEALRKADAAVALALADDVHDIIAGGVLCGVIFTCRNAGHWERASDWTDVAASWADRMNVSMFPGICQVHRCEILRVRGDLDQAEVEAQRAIGEFDEVAPAPRLLGYGWHELGRIRLIRGDRQGAREAFATCVGLGGNAQPGLALFHLAAGQPETAREQLEPLADGLRLVGEQAFVLPVLIEACVELNDIASAREHLARMGEIAEGCGTDSHGAAHALCSARIALATSDLDDARRAARTAIALFGAAGDPFQVAAAHELLGEVELARGFGDAASFAFAAAEAAYGRVGALADANRVSSRTTAAPEATFAKRAFLFTDIVDSTRLQVALGDRRWLQVLDAHDALHIKAIERQAGTVVKHEGDGFFASFADGAHALRAACAIQQALIDQRRTTGFSLDVRMGVHVGEAALRNGDWFGIAVTTAARVAAAAEAGEVLCTSSVRASTPGARVVGERLVEAKGLAEALTVYAVDACS